VKDDLLALLDYEAWAGRLLAASLAPLSHDDYVREVPSGAPSIRATLVHLAGATHNWAERFEGRDATVLPTAEELPTLAAALAMLDDARARITAFAGDATPERLAAPLVWRNLKGEPKAAPLWTVLRHVVNHASYHRGQVAAALRRVGLAPAATDLVRWAIERHEAGAFEG
jgi:uncharacterized damage-inducible protein DinB